jgi:hypothetical protein
MILPGETEAGTAGTQPCRGIPRWAHRDDERGREDSFLRRPTSIGSKDPHASKIPARRAEYSLTENVASPFQAEPRQVPPSPRGSYRFRVSSDRRLKGLSRVRGNSHARFLEGWAGAIPPGYSTAVGVSLARNRRSPKRPSRGPAASTRRRRSGKRSGAA